MPQNLLLFTCSKVHSCDASSIDGQLRPAALFLLQYLILSQMLQSSTPLSSPSQPRLRGNWRVRLQISFRNLNVAALGTSPRLLSYGRTVLLSQFGHGLTCRYNPGEDAQLSSSFLHPNYKQGDRDLAGEDRSGQGSDAGSNQIMLHPALNLRIILTFLLHIAQIPAPAHVGTLIAWKPSSSCCRMPARLDSTFVLFYYLPPRHTLVGTCLRTRITRLSVLRQVLASPSLQEYARYCTVAADGNRSESNLERTGSILCF